MKNKENLSLPKDGWEGFKAHSTTDAISGFIVFLLALPLSLGIAKASDFPPIMGLITAIVGGVFVSFIMGSRLSIKGPAAGLIVIVAGAVAEFGGGEAGWKMALGAIFIAGIIQVLFGLFKWGRMVDFFPLSAIHGMLAAIGLIIISKQIPVLLNVDPAITKGKNPIELIGAVPQFIGALDPRATGIGLISLVIMLGWPMIKNVWLKKIPAPLLVLMIAIPAELIMGFQTTEPAYALVHIGNLFESVRVNIDFAGFAQTGIFVKYVIMFALVGSLESLLTVKAVDLMDPWQRKSNANQDLIATGAGNVLASVLGGLPMISEVARSSANINNGAKTRWSNFYHGFFILAFVLLASRYIEMIPNTALAAMLISVGYRLAHPKEFIGMFKIGKEQLAIFLVTIFFTMYEDLLIGIAAGIVLKITIHLINGAPLKYLFRAPVEISFNDGVYRVVVAKAAVFSNFLSIKHKLESIPGGMKIILDLGRTTLVDHSVISSLNHFKKEYENGGGQLLITGLERHKPLSNHKEAAVKKKKTSLSV